MKIKEIAAAVERIAPLALAQDWDNVGFLVGDADRNIKNVLITIDVTSAVIEEALKLKVSSLNSNYEEL